MPAVFEGKDASATVETTSTDWDTLTTIPQEGSAPLGSTGTHKIVIQARDDDSELSKVWSLLVSWRFDVVAGFTQVGPIIEGEPQGDIGTEDWGYALNAGSGAITVGSGGVGAAINWAYTADYVVSWPNSVILTEDIDDSQTDFIVNGTPELDSSRILIDDERMQVTARDLPGPIGSITVERGYEGTTPASHSEDAFIYEIALLEA